MGDLVLDLWCCWVESYTHSMILRITRTSYVLIALYQKISSIWTFQLLGLFTILLNCVIIIIWRVSSIIHHKLFASTVDTRARIYSELWVIRIILLLLLKLFLILLLLTLWFLLTCGTSLWLVETFKATLVYRNFNRLLLMIYGLLMLVIVLLGL